MDVLIARPIFPGDAAQWFCLHALANAFVVVGAVPDFYFVSLMPSKALSAAHCYEMGKWACSDWPTCMIVAIHIYHMLAFKLTADDLFHHLTFVPVIGGGHFVWPWGAAGNILCFFISGFPGGIDYALTDGSHHAEHPVSDALKEKLQRMWDATLGKEFGLKDYGELREQLTLLHEEAFPNLRHR